jgi:hypothetical protein
MLDESEAEVSRITGVIPSDPDMDASGDWQVLNLRNNAGESVIMGYLDRFYEQTPAIINIQIKPE